MLGAKRAWCVAVRPLDEISLTRMKVECVVGIFPGEREVPQPLEVSLSMALDVRAVQREGLRASVDYGRLWGELKFLLERCRFRTLETAAEVLCRFVLAPPTVDAERGRVHEAKLTLTKPDALGGEAVPSLRVHRFASEYPQQLEVTTWGGVELLHEAERTSVYRLRVAPGRAVDGFVHEGKDTHELVLGAGLSLDGAVVRRGTAYGWPPGAKRTLHNGGTLEQTVLCVERPATGTLQRSAEGQLYYPSGDGLPEPLH